MEKIRIFIDMDGTLCLWKASASPEELYEEDFFSSMVPDERALALARAALRAPDYEVFVLSAVLEDSIYAEQEKRLWLDRNIPEIDNAHRIFVKCGTPKSQAIQGGLRPTDVLIDDYSLNLHEWHKAGGLAVKFFNGVNGTRGTWGENMPHIPADIAPNEGVAYLAKWIHIRLVEQQLKYVARIEWLNTRGEVANFQDYATAAEFEETVKEDLHFGVPLSIVIYRTADGATIPYDFVHEQGTLPKALRVAVAAEKTERKAQPKLWAIPCVWQCFGVMQVEACSLSEAIEIACSAEVGLPDGEYIQDSFEVDTSEEEIREMYNDGQLDAEEV